MYKINKERIRVSGGPITSVGITVKVGEYIVDPIRAVINHNIWEMLWEGIFEHRHPPQG